MNEHCLYITKHVPTGKFYVGKGKTALVSSGKYRGSGSLILKYLKKYPKNEWTTSILQTFNSAEAAFFAEGKIVTEELVASEMSLNLKTGGVGNCKHTQATKLKMSAAHQNRKPWSEERRERTAFLASQRTGWQHTPEAKAKMSEARRNRKVL